MKKVTEISTGKRNSQIFVIVTLYGQIGRKTFGLCHFVSLILALVQRRSNTMSVDAHYTKTNKLYLYMIYIHFFKNSTLYMET